MKGMYLKFYFRNNPTTKVNELYFNLVESHRNFEDRIYYQTMLNIGFLNNYTEGQLSSI